MKALGFRIYKGILSVRNEAKSAIRSLVGTGCDVDLLHFPWLPQGPILDRYDFLFRSFRSTRKLKASGACLLRVIPGIFLSRQKTKSEIEDTRIFWVRYLRKSVP